MTPSERLAAVVISAAERGRVPDTMIRLGTRALVANRLRAEEARDPSERAAFWAAAQEGPIALSPDLANAQHYDVPAAFFDLVLGPRRKYSSAWWPSGVTALADAEEAMLSLTAERAGLDDGQTVLDLGCGWGSLTLWAAERFPDSTIVGMSNSAGQRRHILGLAQERGLGNVDVVTADINDFDPGRRFDRIVSVEMLEHVRNHRALFERMRGWLADDGAAFVHVFAHRAHAYPFEVDGPGSWMARTFFSDGVMPSARLVPAAAAPGFEVSGDWWIDGTHYARTLDAWLERMDRRRPEVRAVLADADGDDDVDVRLQRWRMFFMACSALFGYRGGGEWGIAHHRLEPA